MGEIIFFVLITLFLIFKLYSLFNKSDESDMDEELKEKYSRYIWFFEGKSPIEDKEETKQEKEADVEKEVELSEELELSPEDIVIRRVKTVFPEFDPLKFKRSAAMVYKMLFDALQEGKIKDIKDLVTSEILTQLKSTYSAFTEKNEKLVNSNISVNVMEFVDFSELGGVCNLTVHISAKRCCYVQSNTDESILKGSDEKLSSFDEVWKFQKKKDSTDPVWLVSFIEQN